MLAIIRDSFDERARSARRVVGHHAMPQIRDIPSFCAVFCFVKLLKLLNHAAGLTFDFITFGKQDDWI